MGSRSLPLVERGGPGWKAAAGCKWCLEARRRRGWRCPGLPAASTQRRRWRYTVSGQRRENGVNKSTEPILPEDPRLWSRADVCEWVAWMCRSHSLPRPNTERFLMNGKAVCLMSVTMFTSRVPLGGKLLYRDFQIRLASALHKKV